MERNKDFTGRVSLAGHSLGSVILFDLLSHQIPLGENEEKVEALNTVKFQPMFSSSQRPVNQKIDYSVSLSGTGQPLMNYPQLKFQPKNFFALGSPIGMFVTIRGIINLGMDFRLPTCEAFFNIFHPYDPIAYRIEPLINPMVGLVPPSLVPHHKGRKRTHLIIKETMNFTPANLKSRLMASFRNLPETLGASNPLINTIVQNIEHEVNKVLERQLSAVAPPETASAETDSDENLSVGQLNQSRRLDYVLQEGTLETLNEYVFALGSHTSYWESADTALFVAKEIYSSVEAEADKDVQPYTLKMLSDRTPQMSS